MEGRRAEKKEEGFFFSEGKKEASFPNAARRCGASGRQGSCSSKRMRAALGKQCGCKIFISTRLPQALLSLTRWLELVSVLPTVFLSE